MADNENVNNGSEHQQQPDSIPDGVGSADGDGVAGSYANPVTRIAPITPNNKNGVDDAHYLAHGIDTLDLNFYVDWGSTYYHIEKELRESKLSAQYEHGSYILKSEYFGECMIHAKGRGKGYAYHLQYNDFHMWVAPQLKPLEKPNILVSPAAEWLWRVGSEEVVAELTALLSEAGGTIERHQISRVDLASDWSLTGVPTQSYFAERIVSRSSDVEYLFRNGKLGTVYVGNKRSPIQVRLYDKTTQILETGSSDWILQYWEPINLGDAVWRVEFQLRRRALAELGIETLDDLKEKLGGLWELLTSKNLSLREPDNKNTQRRTLSRWWQQVVDIRGMWGKRCELKRVSDAPKERDPAWYVRQLAGFIVSYAACRAIKSKTKAAEELLAEAMERLDMRDWTSAYAKKRISMGLPVEEPEVFGDLF